jgi:hypothetical protein
MWCALSVRYAGNEGPADRGDDDVSPALARVTVPPLLADVRCYDRWAILAAFTRIGYRL